MLKTKIGLTQILPIMAVLALYSTNAHALNCYADNDGDGFGAGTATVEDPCTGGRVSNNNDCDDAHANVHPRAPELVDNVDNNCDGNTDEARIIYSTARPTAGSTAKFQNPLQIRINRQSLINGLTSNFSNYGYQLTVEALDGSLAKTTYPTAGGYTNAGMAFDTATNYMSFNANTAITATLGYKKVYKMSIAIFNTATQVKYEPVNNGELHEFYEVTGTAGSPTAVENARIDVALKGIYELGLAEENYTAGKQTTTYGSVIFPTFAGNVLFVSGYKYWNDPAWGESGLWCGAFDRFLKSMFQAAGYLGGGTPANSVWNSNAASAVKNFYLNPNSTTSNNALNNAKRAMYSNNTDDRMYDGTSAGDVVNANLGDTLLHCAMGTNNIGHELVFLAVNTTTGRVFHISGDDSNNIKIGDHAIDDGVGRQKCDGDGGTSSTGQLGYVTSVGKITPYIVTGL